MEQGLTYSGSTHGFTGHFGMVGVWTDAGSLKTRDNRVNVVVTFA